MPPRKSDVRPSTPVVAAEEASPSSAKGLQIQDKQEKKDKDKEKDKDKGKTEDAVTIEDLTLPKSIITRLAKGILPPNTQIQGNAILALSKSATVFISYLASHANENTVAAGKKTILPADVFKALDDTEFSFLKGPLEAEFAKFNAIQTEKRTSYRQKVRAASKHSPGDDTDMADTTIASEASASSGPRAKKARVDASAADNDEDDEEIDAIVNDDDDVVDDDEEDEDGDEETQEDDEQEDAADEDEDEAGDGEGSSDETQDALEERRSREEPDEALEGDESD
ncbi:DNA polymerase epsilon subunit D [Trichoderma ghanense]|uniref:DNA polymerase epsilon subunit D n=1 Tax=Trichoderma ghanense TaxID=65468 RepID=A0ABY2H8V2_9HYPO